MNTKDSATPEKPKRARKPRPARTDKVGNTAPAAAALTDTVGHQERANSEPDTAIATLMASSPWAVKGKFADSGPKPESVTNDECGGCAALSCAPHAPTEDSRPDPAAARDALSAVQAMEKDIYGRTQFTRSTVPVEDVVPGIWRLALSGIDSMRAIGKNLGRGIRPLLHRSPGTKPEVDDITKHFS